MCNFCAEEGLCWLLVQVTTQSRYGEQKMECLNTITGHSARVWDISSNHVGKLIASASGDGDVKLWDIKNLEKFTCLSSLRVHEGDAYAVQFHPGQGHIATGGYDKTVRLIDVRTGLPVKTLSVSFKNHLQPSWKSDYKWIKG